MKPLHLLVTDDDLDKRMLLTRAIAREFPRASIFECHSGQEALDFFDRNPVDAVVTNHSMFPVNGIELVQELRRRGSSVPIVMVSSHTETRTEAEAAGVDLFLDGDWIGVGKPIGEFFRQRGLVDQVET